MSNFAMIFPGQGSQYIGMLADLAKNFSIVEETFAESSSIVKYNLWDLVQHGSKKELDQTFITQPALLSASVAIFRIWEKNNGRMPKLMAGHSLGEYSALVCAGVIDFKAAIKLVELRGKFMQESVPQGMGAMYAIIGLTTELVITVCQKVTTDQIIVSVVSFNSPEQVVIAGEKNAVKKAAALCKAAGAKYTLPLSVSTPSHCALMQPAANKFAQILEMIVFNQPKIAVINNVDVKIENSVDRIRNALVRQLYNPVRWVEIIEFMVGQGINQLLEIGPGKVLTGLTQSIRDRDTISLVAINDSISLNNALIQTKL